ncbi:MAG: peptidylprolyl isomerase [Gemmatimonadales bacterium]
MRFGLIVALVGGGLLAPASAAAQDAQLLDRIVAIVGTRAILSSQIDETLVQMRAQGRELPTDSAALAALHREVLEQMIEEELLVQQAQRDTMVKVTEQEVLDQVEQTYQNVRRQFTSDAEFREQLRAARFGTVEEWRRWLADQQRRALYARRLIETQQQQGKLRPIAPTEAEMREFWEANRGQQQQRPATVSFRQIVIRAQPDSAARERAWRRADSLVTALRRGADFATAARRFSDDSSTRERGGELGWFRRGVMVKEFEDVAFLLRPGDISPPVETTFGYHIIQVERTQPAEVLARHILIAPEISAAQVEQARQRAASVHGALVRGTATAFDSLARLYADPNEPKLAEGVPLDSLPSAYRERLARDTTSGLKPVIAVGAGSRRPTFAVLEVTERRPAGVLTFEDVRLRIRQTLSEQLAIQHYIDELRQQTYVAIRL